MHSTHVGDVRKDHSTVLGLGRVLSFAVDLRVPGCAASYARQLVPGIERMRTCGKQCGA